MSVERSVSYRLSSCSEKSTGVDLGVILWKMIAGGVFVAGVWNPIIPVIAYVGLLVGYCVVGGIDKGRVCMK